MGSVHNLSTVDKLFIVTIILIIPIIQMIPCTGIKGNNDNTINTDNKDNIGKSSFCGSGKKYKQCCGK